MAKNDVRPVIKLRSTAGTGYTYVTRKNRRNDPDRMVVRKYDPMVRRRRRVPGRALMASPVRLFPQVRAVPGPAAGGGRHVPSSAGRTC